MNEENVKAGEASAAVKSGATVVIGCKLPHGLVMELGIEQQQVGTGTQLTRGPSYQRFTVKGANAARIVGGYGVTQGVPADFAAAWMEKNKNLQFVRDGLIFIVKSAADAKSEAKDRLDVKTGLEAIDPLAKKGGNPTMDAQAIAAYRKQVAENPARNRQIDELQSA